MLLYDDYTAQESNFNKICCFYAGKGHFLSVVGRFIIQKIKKGSKVLMFSDCDIRDKLIETADCLVNNCDPETLACNIVQFPCKSIGEMMENKYFSNYLCKLITLLGNDCSDEGLIVCINDASKEVYGLMDELQQKLEDLNTPLFFINCYGMTNDQQMVADVLKNHDYILKTIGLKKTENISDDLNNRLLS